MRYPEVRYIETPDEMRLELHVMDGTSRMVAFHTVGEALAALLPGRADIDAAAVFDGRLPVGCCDVTAVVARPVAELLQETFEVAEPASYDPRDGIRIRAATAAAVARARFQT